MIKISAIEGNSQWLDGGSMFGNAPRAVWEKWTKVDPLGRIPLACRCLLIETQNYKILCEAGIGSFFEPKLAQRFGVQNIGRHMLLENLANLGHSPESIDYVILSHLHFDHAGGLLPTYDQIQAGEQGLVFKNAKFLVGKNAWERAQSPHFRDRASFIPHLNSRLEQSEKLVIIENNEVPSELSHFIKFFESNGHTPGQMHTIIKSNQKTIVFAGDLIPGVPWVHLPITMGYDRYPEKLIEEKQALYQSYLDQDCLLFFTHDSEYAMGALTKNEKNQYIVKKLQKNFVELTI